MTKLYYGAAYYYEYLPYPQPFRLEKLEEDLTLMKEAGMNVIRIGESTWSTYEKQEGQYDFFDLKITIEKAKEHGLDVIVGTCTYAIPSWLARKVPSVMLSSEKGSAIYGHRQQFNLSDPVYRQYCQKIIEKMMEAIQNYDNVIGFQIDNETHHQSVFNQQVQMDFLESLKAEYGEDFERLNRDFLLDYWSNRIDNWDDFPPLEGTINYSLLSKFESFRRKTIDDFFAFQIDIINKYRRPDQFVTHNFDFGWKGHSYGIHPELNQFETAKLLDVVGGDIYHPTRYRLDGSDISFCGQLMYSLKQKDYLILETQSSGDEHMLPLPGQVRLCAFAHLANGARMVEYWPWSAIHTAIESRIKGVLNHDRIPGRIYREVSSVGHDFERLAEHLIPLKRNPKIAILTNKASQDQLSSFDWKEPQRAHNAYNDVVRSCADALYHWNQEYMVLDEENLPENLNAYQLIICPAMYAVKAETAARLRSYTEQGGNLAATYWSFQGNEVIHHYPEAVPYRLTDVFGLRMENGFVKDIEEYANVVEGGYVEEVVLDGATRIAADTSAEGVVYEHDFGQGKAWYIAGELTKEAGIDVWYEILQSSTIAQMPYTFPIVVKEGKNPAGRTLSYIMNFQNEPATIVSCFAGVELFSGKSVSVNDQMNLDAWGVKIVESE